MAKLPIFTVDWEDIWDGVPDEGPSLVHEPTVHLLNLLRIHGVTATFYILGKTRDANPETYRAIVNAQHRIKSHGYHHVRYEDADRKPYENLGATGGFYFRALPYWLIKRNVIANRHFYIHPHDIIENHPRLSNPLLNWKRQIGRQNAYSKLYRLLSEIKWGHPCQ